MHSEYVVLRPGDTFEETVAWNGAGMVGDVRITAEVWTFADEADRDNNYREVDHYVIVGGSGFGAGV